MKKYATSVHARTIIEGVHWWPEAPDHVAYLRYLHRHQFVIISTAPVGHDNRDIEFITLGHQVENVLRSKFRKWQFDDSLVDFGTASCEMIAKEVLESEIGVTRCSVYEDGENGATVLAIQSKHGKGGA